MEDAPSDGDKHPGCFSGFHLAADELDIISRPTTLHVIRHFWLPAGESI
jgi:hypothetical protein